MKVIGVDIGAQKSMMVADDGDIVLTDTGSISRPTLVSFLDRSRLVGEEAAPQISNDSTISLLNLLIGKKDIISDDMQSHRRYTLTSSSSGLNVEVTYCDKKETFSVTAILAIFISKLYKRAVAVYGDDIRLSFALSPSYDVSVPRAIKEACMIANIDDNKLSFVDSSDCIVATYHRKLQALRGGEKSVLENKKTLLVEVGHTKSTVVITEVTLQNDQLVPTKVAYSTDLNLGALNFDFALFKHFAEICKKQHQNTEILPGTKRGQRLLFACERARKLLSQLPDAKITVENLTDAGDVNFSIRRDDFAQINNNLILQFKNLINDVLSKATLSASDISAVEIVGGGIRMPILQNVIQSFFGESIPLGAKFDDASIALGASLHTLKSITPTTTVVTNGSGTATPQENTNVFNFVVFANQLPVNDTNTIGLTSEEINQAKKREESMEILDKELQQILIAKNNMESFILEMRSAPRRKHGEKINNTLLEKLLSEYENWMWDNEAIDLLSLQVKENELKTKVNEICKDYFEWTEKDRLAVEKALESEAIKAENEKTMNGEEEADNDNRKLRKPERMRMVVKNKDEGTELFKGGNYRPAAARYAKALSHCAKFFDLSADDEIEVKNIKTTLYLNMASCYLKMENWDQALRQCNDAMELEPNNIKGLFRRACAYEGKKDLDKCLLDLKKCQELNDVEDKQVTKMFEKIKKDIQKEKDKEKKMWGKAFS